VQKDLPIQLLVSSQPLRATLLLASFGKPQPFSNHVFNLDVRPEPNSPAPKYEKPLRYGKLPEIHHIFRPDPKSGPVIISIVFVLAVLAPLPILFGTVSTFYKNNVFNAESFLTVDLPRRESGPSPESHVHSASVTYALLRLNIGNGSNFLPVLL
jgi:Oligosaccharyltransferase subunit Ribophorin II